jgi:hypothetical protein
MTAARRPWYTILYVQVLLAIAADTQLKTAMAHPIAVGEELEERPV